MSGQPAVVPSPLSTMPPETCPNCGADVPRAAKACPACGADESTGWSDSAYAGRLGIPEENFDYDRFVHEEFAPRRVKPRGIHWLWWLTALVLIGLFFWFYFR
jgi:RNA polymerase subunit RPABC4/transcription elongation factor Spt4